MADAPKQNINATKSDVSCPENVNYFSSGEPRHSLVPVNTRKVSVILFKRCFDWLFGYHRSPKYKLKRKDKYFVDSNYKERIHNVKYSTNESDRVLLSWICSIAYCFK